MLVTLLFAVFSVSSSMAQDAKEYKTYVKNDRLVHYCNYNGITVVVDVTDYGLFEPHISIINDTGKEILFEPKKMKAYCFGIKHYGNETRNQLTPFFKRGLTISDLEQKTTLVKDSIRIYTYEKYYRSQSTAMFWGNALAAVIVGVADAAFEPNTPEGRYWARAHFEEMAEEGNAQRRYELARIDEGYWRANTIFDMSEHTGFVGLKRRKTDHIVLEIPVGDELFTFFVDNKKRY